jgi:hypothetical protein
MHFLNPLAHFFTKGVNWKKYMALDLKISLRCEGTSKAHLPKPIKL